jgi:hypothetical protein
VTAWIDGWILRLTARRWNRLIARVLCRAYSDRVITSKQLHTLTREFDPTQDGTVSRLPQVTEPRWAVVTHGLHGTPRREPAAPSASPDPMSQPRSPWQW